MFNPGDLNFLLARDRLVRKVRVEQNIREQLNAGLQVRFHHMNADTHAVVAGVARDRSTDRFDLIRDLFGRARLCSLKQNTRGQTCNSIRLRGFGEQSAPKNGANRNQRQARILVHEQAQPIRKFDFLDFARGQRPCRLSFRTERTFGIQ